MMVVIVIDDVFRIDDMFRIGDMFIVRIYAVI